MGLAFVGRRNDPLGLVAVLLRQFLVARLHLLVRDIEFGLPRVVGGNLRRRGAVQPPLGQMFLNLMTPRTGRGEVFLGIASNFWLTAASTVDFVAQLLQARGQFGAVDGGPQRLRSVNLARLQRADVAVVGLGEIEEDDVRVELRGGVLVDRAGAVVLEGGRHPPARRFGRMIAAQSRLHVLLDFLEGNIHALPAGLANALVAADEGRDRDALRRRERGVPSGAVGHRRDLLPARVRRAVRDLMADERFVGRRMVAFGEPGKGQFLHLAGKAPLAREPAVPFATNLLALGVVVLLRVLEFFLVIQARLRRAQRPRHRDHDERLLSIDATRG